MLDVKKEKLILVYNCLDLMEFLKQYFWWFDIIIAHKYYRSVTSDNCIIFISL